MIPLSDKQIDTIKSGWADPEVTTNQIGKLTGIAPTTIRGIAGRMGLGPKATGKSDWSGPDDADFKAAVAEGLNSYQLAERFEVGRGAITGLARRLKLKIRGGSRTKATPAQTEQRKQARTRTPKVAKPPKVKAAPKPKPQPTLRPKTEPRAQSKVFGETKVKPAYIIAGCGAVIEKPPGEAPKVPTKKRAFHPLPGSTPIPWTERTIGACAWPVDVEGEDVLHSCGCKAEGKWAYCRDHLKLRHGNGTPSERNADQPRRVAR